MHSSDGCFLVVFVLTSFVPSFEFETIVRWIYGPRTFRCWFIGCTDAPGSVVVNRNHFLERLFRRYTRSLFGFCSDWSLLSWSYKRTPSLVLFISNLSKPCWLYDAVIFPPAVWQGLGYTVWRLSFILQRDASTFKKSYLSLFSKTFTSCFHARWKIVDSLLLWHNFAKKEKFIIIQNVKLSTFTISTSFLLTTFLRYFERKFKHMVFTDTEKNAFLRN